MKSVQRSTEIRGLESAIFRTLTGKKKMGETIHLEKIFGELLKLRILTESVRGPSIEKLLQKLYISNSFPHGVRRSKAPSNPLIETNPVGRSSTFDGR